MHFPISQDKLPSDYANTDSSDPSGHYHLTFATARDLILLLHWLRKDPKPGHAMLRPTSLGSEPRVRVGVPPCQVLVLFSELAHLERTVCHLLVFTFHISRSQYIEGGAYHRTHQRFPVRIFVQENVSKRLHLVRNARVTSRTGEFQNICPLVWAKGAPCKGDRAYDELRGGSVVLA
jgi:hypothetical protein